MKHLLQSVAGFFGIARSDFSFTGYAPPPRVGPKVEFGGGAHRARKRLNAKLKANKLIPSGDRMTRQRLRAMKRAAVKESRITPAEFGRRKMEVLKRAKAAVA